MDDVWRCILRRHLSPRDICRLAQTCRKLHRLCTKEDGVWDTLMPGCSYATFAELVINCGPIFIIHTWFHILFPFAAELQLFRDDPLLCDLYVLTDDHRVGFSISVLDGDGKIHVPTLSIDEKRIDGLTIFELMYGPIQQRKQQPIKSFVYDVLRERRTPHWIWENNPVVKECIRKYQLYLRMLSASNKK
jgi:hypothetical protein